MSGEPLSDAASGAANLRSRYRPECVRVLLVGESAPAGGTHFYFANSNLFRATREGFQQALGSTAVPVGSGFLGSFRESGWWLVDLADRPVNHLEGASRRHAVREGIPRLIQTVDDTRPDIVIGVGKTNVGDPMRAAVRQARHDPQAVGVLPFPLFQGRATYIEGIRLAVLATSGHGPSPDDAKRSRRADAGG